MVYGSSQDKAAAAALQVPFSRAYLRQGGIIPVDQSLPGERQQALEQLHARIKNHAREGCLFGAAFGLSRPVPFHPIPSPPI